MKRFRISVLFSMLLIIISACGGGGSTKEVVDTPPNSANSAPIANDDNVDLMLSGEITIDVLENDSDSDGNSLTIVEVTQASSGTASIVNNKIEYKAGSSAEVLTLDYVVSDGITNSQPATVTLNIKPLTMSLSGRVVFAPLGTKVVVNLESEAGVNTSITAIDENGQYLLPIEINDLNTFVSLSAADPQNKILYYSKVATAAKLLSMVDDQNTVSYLDYLQLEISPLSTALSVYVDLFNVEPGVLNDIRLEQLFEMSSGDSVFKLAVLIKRMFDGEISLPDNVASLEELYSDREAITAFIKKYPGYEYEAEGDLVLEATSHYSATESLVNDLAFMYTREDSQATFNLIPSSLENLGDGTFYFTSLLSTSGKSGGFVTNYELESRLSLSLNSSNALELTSTSVDPMDDLFHNQRNYVSECDLIWNILMTFRKIQIMPVYKGETVDQYLVRYSGDSVPGYTLNNPCAGATDLDWSKVMLVNVSKSTSTLADSLAQASIAIRIGTDEDHSAQYYSTSIINLNSDGTALVKLNNTTANWNFNSSGDLALTLNDGSKIVYHAIQYFGLATRYIAHKTFVSGERKIFTGLTMNVDENLAVDTMVGRYEFITDFKAPAKSARTFQSNLLGQDEAKNENGDWIVLNYPIINTFNWREGENNKNILLNYLVKTESDDSYTNMSIQGCDEMDDTCYLWRTRDYRLLAVDGEYYYMTVNTWSDYNYSGFDVIERLGFLGVYRKTDFVLPPVE